MIADLRPYPAMKASGVPWLGEVPEHWEVASIGCIGQLFKGNGGSKEDEVPVGVPCVRYGDLYTKHEFFIRNTKAFVTPERAAHYTSIRYGDVLFAASGETIEDIGRSAVNLIETDACCGGDVLLLRPKEEVVAKFFGYAADSDASRHQKACMGRGFTVVHIYGTQLKQLVLAVPPLPEQSAIVRFLDHADRRIRRCIGAKQKLIKLVEEQKQTIIHRAVTRGLDPNVRLKPSGMEWLGDVPEHWEVVRLKEVTTSIEQGWSPQCDAQPAADHEWGVLKVGCVNRDIFDASQNKRLPPTLAPIPELQIRDGDILVSRANTRELLGLAALVLNPREKLMLCDKLFRFRAKPECADPKFLIYTMRQRTSRSQIESSTNGASNSMQNIGQDVIRNLLLTLPPLDEQRNVVVALEAQTSTLLTALAQANREIALLREYRTRLIADVVTGKLDVREEAEKLPNKGPELLDEMEELSQDESVAEDIDIEAADAA